MAKLDQATIDELRRQKVMTRNALTWAKAKRAREGAAKFYQINERAHWGATKH